MRPGLALARHLDHRLGQWPPELPLDVVGSGTRTRPGWDGAVRRLVGVLDPLVPSLGEPGLLLSVPPDAVEPVELLGGLDPSVLAEPAWCGAVAQALGAADHAVGVGVFRWLEHASDVADLDELGTWVPRGEPGLPAWLQPFDAPEVLVLRDADGAHLAGVGIKSHDEFGAELAVVTEPGSEGRGFGRRLVATAARRILAEGRVITYLHDPDNLASARLAEAVGFHDDGWRIVGLFPPAGGRGRATGAPLSAS